MEQQDLITGDFSVDAAISMHLKETGMWARFLGIVGIVFSFLFAIIALFAGTILANMGGVYSQLSSSSAGTITVSYLLIAVVAFFASLFLYRFGKKTKLALLQTNQEQLTAAFLNLKLYHRIAGIITILYLVIITLAILGGVLVGLSSR